MYFLGFVIRFFYDIVNNYGVAIVLFTIFVKLILMPLTIKQQKSMMATQKIQPQLKVLQEKYKNDKEKLSQEQMKLYKENNVNPAGGCLPMFIQLPIILCLWWVIKKPVTYIMGVGYADVWRLFEAMGQYMTASVGGVPQELYGNMKEFWGFVAQNAGETPKNIIDIFTNMYSKFDPAALEPMKTIAYQNFGNGEIEVAQYIYNNPDILKSEILTSVPQLANLRAIDFRFLGLNLAATPNINSFSWLWSIPILSGLTTFLSSKLTPQQNTANSEQGNSMQMMMYFFPLFSAWIAFTLPAGVGVYWVISNLTQMIQQVCLNKFLSPSKEDENIKEVVKVEKNRKNRKKSR